MHVGSMVMSHPLAGVGTLSCSGGMLIPPFGLPPGALITLVLNQRRLDLIWNRDGWVGQRRWWHARFKISVADKWWWRWSHGLCLHCCLVWILCSVALACDLTQHYLIQVDLVHTGANNPPTFSVFFPSKTQSMIGGMVWVELVATTKLWVIPIPHIEGNLLLKACWADMP